MTQRMRIVLGVLAIALVVVGVVALAQGMRSQALAKVQTAAHSCQGQTGAGAQGGACSSGTWTAVGQSAGSAGQHVCSGDASKACSGACPHAETGSQDGAACAEGGLPHACSGTEGTGKGCGQGMGQGYGAGSGCRGMTGAGCSR